MDLKLDKKGKKKGTTTKNFEKKMEEKTPVHISKNISQLQSNNNEEILKKIKELEDRISSKNDQPVNEPLDIGRKQITNENINNIMQLFGNMLRKRFEEKGRHSLASRHEIFGVIAEEYHELCEAMKDNSSIRPFEDELADLAIAAVYGLICIEAGGIEW